MKKEIQLPDIVKDASKEVQDNYVKYMQLYEQLETHPERLQDLELQNGETVTIDCAAPVGTIDRLIIKYKLNEKQQNKVRQVTEKVRAIISKKQSFRLKYEHGLKKENKQTITEQLTPKIIELLSEWNSPREVNQMLKKEGFSITYEQVRSVYKKNKPKIEVLRNDKAKELVSSSIGSETGRLNTLSNMHRYYYERWNIDKKNSDANMIFRIQELARAELKVNELRISIDGKIDINANIQASESLERIKGKFAVHSFILNQVAFNMGKNPARLQNMLSNHYYKKYSGFDGAPPIKQDKQETYLSKLTRGYNWDDIKRMNKDIEEAEIISDEQYQHEQKEDDTDTDKKKKGEALRRRLLFLLNNTQQKST